MNLLDTLNLYFRVVTVQIVNLIDCRFHPIKKLAYSSKCSVLRTPWAITQLFRTTTFIWKYCTLFKIVSQFGQLFFLCRQTSVLLQTHLFWKYCTLFIILSQSRWLLCVCVCVQVDKCFVQFKMIHELVFYIYIYIYIFESMVSVLVWTFFIVEY